MYIYILGVLGWSHRKVSARNHTSAVKQNANGNPSEIVREIVPNRSLRRPGRAKSMVFTVRNALGRSKSMVFTARIAHRTSKIAPGGPLGDLGRFGARRGCSWDAPGGARRALATLPARPGTPPDAPWTPRSDQKASRGGPESICGSVLFGQSFARRYRNDFRTFSGPSGEVRTSILLRPASVL